MCLPDGESGSSPMVGVGEWMDALDGWSHVLSLGGVAAMGSTSGGEEEGSCGVVLDWVMGGGIW